MRPAGTVTAFRRTVGPRQPRLPPLREARGIDALPRNRGCGVNAYQATIDRLRTLVHGDGHNRWDVKLDRPITAPLKTTGMTMYYPPSKFLHLDFRVDQYLIMQAERHAPPETNPALQKLRKLLITVRQNTEAVGAFLDSLSPKDFRQNPTLKDLAEVFAMAAEQGGVAGPPSTPRLSLPTGEPGPGGGNGRRRLPPSESRQHPTAYELYIPGIVPKISLEEPRVPSCAEFEAAEREITDDAAAAAAAAAEAGGAGGADSRNPRIPHFRVDVLGDVARALAPPAGGGAAHPPPASTAAAGDDRGDDLWAAAEASGRSPLNVRRRFVDGRYLKRRNFWLYMCQRKEVKPRAARMNKHFLMKPDELRVYPVHKGPTFVRWPSVAH